MKTKIMSQKFAAIAVTIAIAGSLVAGCGSSTGISESDSSSSDISALASSDDSSESSSVESSSTAESTANEESSAVATTLATEDQLVEPDIDKTEALDTTERPQYNGYVTNRAGEQLQIVFFGDSQFDNFRDTSGVVYQIMQYCEANVYNCAIGGSSASYDKNDNTSTDSWNSLSGVGMSMVATGALNPSYLADYTAYGPVTDCNFENTDVFVIEYGVNDYLAKHPLHGGTDTDPYSYHGAIDLIVSNLKNKYPNALYIVCTPTYAFFNGKHIGNLTGDGNILSNGYATLSDYAGTAKNAADKLQVCYFDAYNTMGMDASTQDVYLLDGIHMNDSARHKYANMLAGIILRQIGYSMVKEGTDLDSFDFSTLTR